MTQSAHETISEVSVTATSVQVAADVTLTNTRYSKLRIQHGHATLIVYVSFDGVSKHAKLDPAAGTSAVDLPAHGVAKVWLWLSGAGTVTVTVEAHREAGSGR